MVRRAFLWAAKEILAYNDPPAPGEDWSKVLKLHVSYHKPYLSECDFIAKSLPTYSPKLQAFPSQALRELGA